MLDHTDFSQCEIVNYRLLLSIISITLCFFSSLVVYINQRTEVNVTQMSSDINVKFDNPYLMSHF